MSYKAKLLTFIFSMSLLLIILLAFAFQFINSPNAEVTAPSLLENRLPYSSLFFYGLDSNENSMDKSFETSDRELLQKIWDTMDFEHWVESQDYNTNSQV